MPIDAAGARGTILVFEDEEEVKTFISKALNTLGYSVILTGDGPSSLETFKVHQDIIKLVILDLALPVMSGVAVYKKLRETDSDMPVILMTGYGIEDEGEGEVDGIEFSGLLRKPFNISELAELVSKVIEPD